MATSNTTVVTTSGAFDLTDTQHLITASQAELGKSESPKTAATAIVIDTAAPTVTINQAAGQDDPTVGLPIHFTVAFSEPVADFDGADVALAGTATGMTVTRVTGSGTTYDVEVRASGSGSITATIPQGLVRDAAGNGNAASTSTDNTVVCNIIPLTVTLNQAANTSDPTRSSTVNFTVVFSRPVADFNNSDLEILGSAGATTAEVQPLGDGRSFNVAVSGMTRTGTVIVSIPESRVTDLSGVGNHASTSVDNRVIYEHVVGQYDFGTSSSAVESGWTRVSHASRYSAAAGFGWSSGTISSRDTRKSTAMKRDVNYTRDGTFVVNVPNGVYDVTAYLGDMAARRDRMVINVKGTNSSSINTTNSVTTWTRRVKVRDGQLTVRLRDTGGSDRYASISGLSIVNVHTPAKLSVSDVAVTELVSGARMAEFVISLDKPADDEVTVDYATANGTALAGSDYVAASGTLRIPLGETSAKISIPVLADGVAETDETFFLNVSNPSGAVLADAQGEGTIEPWRLSVSLSRGLVLETAGSDAATATVTRNGPTDEPLSVTLTSSDVGEASVPATIQIPAGQSSVTFPVGAVDDTLLDGVQWVTIEATSPDYLDGAAELQVYDNERFTGQYDFGTGSSPVQTGYTRVREASQFTASAGYGWQGGTIRSIDRRTGSSLLRDFNYTSDGTFAVNVPNGIYQVVVTLGDLGTTSRDNMAVILEGVERERVTTSARRTVNKTYTIPVTDGQLNLRLRDMGGRDRYAAIEALTVSSIDPALVELMAQSAFQAQTGSKSNKAQATDLALEDLLKYLR